MPGAKGVFDVAIDNTLVYSKHETGKFPTYEQIAEALESQKT